MVIRIGGRIKLSNKNLDNFIFKAHNKGDIIEITDILGQTVEYKFGDRVEYVSRAVLLMNQS